MIYAAHPADLMDPTIGVKQKFFVLQIKFADIWISKTFPVTLKIFLTHFLGVEYVDSRSGYVYVFSNACVQVGAELILHRKYRIRVQIA